MQQSTPDARGHAAPRGAPAGGSVAVVVVSLVGVEFRLRGHWSVRLSTSNCTHGHVRKSEASTRRSLRSCAESWPQSTSRLARCAVGQTARCGSSRKMRAADVRGFRWSYTT